MTVTAWIVCALLWAVPIAAQKPGDKIPGDEYVGTWSGTWDGAGSGGFDLAIEKAEAGLAGTLAITGEVPYKTRISTLSFDGPTMSARYDYPLDDSIEVLLAATFEPTSAAGTWIARQKSGGGELASGTWKVTRK